MGIALTQYCCSVLVILKKIVRDEETNEMMMFISGKENSDTKSQKNLTNFIADTKNSLWTSFKSRKTWRGIFKLIKERSILQQIIAYPNGGKESFT